MAIERRQAGVGEPVDLACMRCPLSKGRTHVVPGKGPARAALVLVGEAPGAEEDKRGEPFVGRAGALLDKALQEAGVSRSSVFITNVVKCRPPSNRKPTSEEAAACRPFLEGELERVSPKVALALGSTAAAALLGRPAKVSEGALTPQESRVGDVRLGVIATLHPSSSRFRKGAVKEIARATAGAADAAGLPRRPSPAQSAQNGARS